MTTTRTDEGGAVGGGHKCHQPAITLTASIRRVWHTYVLSCLAIS
jgi:hypothetical protein